MSEGRDAEHLCLVAVDIGLHARRPGVEESEDEGEAGLPVCFGDHFVRHVLHGAVALAGGILEHHAEAPGRADALDDGRLHDHQAGLVDVGGRPLRLSDQRIDRKSLGLPGLEIFEHPIGRGRAGRLGLRGPVEAR